MLGTPLLYHFFKGWRVYLIIMRQGPICQKQYFTSLFCGHLNQYAWDFSAPILWKKETLMIMVMNIIKSIMNIGNLVC